MKRARKLGWCGYATVYSLILESPLTAIEVGKRLGVSTQTSRRVLERMRDVGYAHRCDWVKPKPRTKSVAMYEAGEGFEPVPPNHHKGLTRCKHNALPEVVAAMNLLRLMQAPIGQEELKAESGGSLTNIRRFLKHCKELGLVHIAGWEKDRPGVFVALWSIGIGPDVAKPRPKSRTQINRDYQRAANAKRRQLTVMRAIAAVNGASYADTRYAEAA